MARKIEVNLSIERSGGAEKLPIVIDQLTKELVKKYPNDEVIVRKGFFQTIDGVHSSDESIEADVRGIIAEVRAEVLK